MEMKNTAFIIIAVCLSSVIAVAQPSWKPLAMGRSFDHIVINTIGHIVVTSMGRGPALRSKDGGKTWNTFIDRKDTVEYYGCDGQGSHYAKIRGKGICRSDDDGKTWTLILTHERYFIHHIGFKHDLTIAQSGNLYMWTQTPKIGLLCSKDKGTTWMEYNNGIESISTAKILCELDSGVLIAQDATYQTYRRRETDSAWNKIDWRFPYPWGPGWETLDYIASSKKGIHIAVGIVGWISRDSGRTWDYNLTRGYLCVRNNNRSMFDSLGNAYLLSYYSGTLRFYIHKYKIEEKSGQSLWYDLSSYGVSFISDLAVLNDGTVFAATDAGLYALKVDLTNVAETHVYNSLKADLYPCPAGHEVTLSICGDQNEDIDVSLYGLLGNVLKSLIVKRSDAYERVLRIDIHDLPDGLYLLNIRGGSKNKVIPFLKK